MKYPGRFDALGFNSVDNYIYGTQLNSNAIVRLKQNNRFDTVGFVNIVDTLKTNAGDCTVDGFYMCHEYSLNQLLVFDVVDNFELVRRIDLFWDPQSQNSGPFTTRIFDLAIDPNNPTVAYTHQGASAHPELQPIATQGYMLRINIDVNDPNVGMVTPINQINPQQATHFGALVFSPFSNLSGFGSAGAGLIPDQNNFYAINLFDGSAMPQMSYPGAVLSDGCSCPFAFTFFNNTPVEGFYCSGDKRKFILEIENYSFNDVENIRLTDTFPEGMIVESVSNKENFNFGTANGLGTRFLEITGLTIPAKRRIELEVYVSSVDVEVGFWDNQAFLHDLPERFGGPMPSDNGFTSGVVGDPSVFSVTTLELLDVEWEIIPPTDCLIANDGKIILKSPQFFPGEPYVVKLRNKIGWDEFTFNVVADQDSSFLLDSLQPGNYQVFQLRASLDNCSLAIKDTTVILEAPNDQLVLTVGSNSPVCEEETLELYSTTTPGGEVLWRGPNIFGSEIHNPIIENATPVNAGEYKVVAEYGFCIQEKVFEVDVKPHVKASLMGESEYCARDQMQLIVEGTGSDLSFDWSGPNNLFYKDSILIIPSIAEEQEGFYEVIVDNGACRDTAEIDITVLPTPSVALPEELKTDFCEPVVLQPEIDGEKLFHIWSPQQGLSCADCPNPQLEFIVQNQYQIYVENSYACNDSATIRIRLDKEALVHTPNVFIVNSTGKNGSFKLQPGCVVNRIGSFEVFDRSGSKVFDANMDPILFDEGWDGYIRGQEGASGVYIWSAEVELMDGSLEKLVGDITLLRR